MKQLKKTLKAIHKNRFLFKCYNFVLDFLYPQFCICCNTPGFKLCPSCIDLLKEKAEKRDACKCCGINLKKQKCSCKDDDIKMFTSVFSLFDFDKQIKSIIHQFKYSGLHSVAIEMGKEFCYLLPEEFIRDVDVVVPVPLHFYRKMKRGYNQSEVLAKKLFNKNEDLHVINVLKRKRNTGTQTSLSKEKREKNLKNAIVINKKYQDQIKNKTVLLVDDVITTGATCNICSKILLEAGVKEVRLLSLARA